MRTGHGFLNAAEPSTKTSFFHMFLVDRETVKYPNVLLKPSTRIYLSRYRLLSREQTEILLDKWSDPTVDWKRMMKVPEDNSRNSPEPEHQEQEGINDDLEVLVKNLKNKDCNKSEKCEKPVGKDLQDSLQDEQVSKATPEERQTTQPASHSGLQCGC